FVRHYRWAREQRTLLPCYRAIVVASEHMKREFVRNGVPPSQIHVNPLFPTHTKLVGARTELVGAGTEHVGAGTEHVGAGFSRTTVRLKADPTDDRDVVRLKADPTDGRDADRRKADPADDRDADACVAGTVSEWTVAFAGRMTVLKGGD